MLMILLSTIFVGLSEETMFRGILFQALRTRVNLWPAMIWTSVLFGSVHILNALTTGELLNAMLQAFTATLSGFCLHGHSRAHRIDLAGDHLPRALGFRDILNLCRAAIGR